MPQRLYDLMGLLHNFPVLYIVKEAIHTLFHTGKTIGGGTLCPDYIGRKVRYVLLHLFINNPVVAGQLAGI